MDFSKFLEVPGDLFLRTPIKPLSDPTPLESKRQGALLGRTSMLLSDPKPAQPASKEKHVSFCKPNLPTDSHEGGRGFKVPTSKVWADLSDWM